MEDKSKELLIAAAEKLSEIDFLGSQDDLLSPVEILQNIAAFPNEGLLEIDLRTLTYIYLCLHPEETQGDFAKKIGTNPATLSRALNTPNQKVKVEWTDGIAKILETLDVSAFIEEVTLIYNKQHKVRVRKLNQKIPMYLSQHVASKMFDSAVIPDTFGQVCEVGRLGNGFLFSDKIDHKWTWAFFDYDYPGIAMQKRTNPFSVADALSEVWPGFRATLFTRKTARPPRIDATIQSSSNNYYRSIMMIDYDGTIIEEIFASGDK